MIRCFILDDEQHAIDSLTKYVLKTPFLQLAGSATNGLEALPQLEQQRIDLLFLDIHMPAISGLELLKLIDVKVILTTAYSEYAFEGYEYDVVDYLLKPIAYTRFLKAAQKAYAIFNTTKDIASAPQPSGKDYFFIKGGHKGKQIRINFDDIDYIESARNYSVFYCGNTKHTTIMNLKEVEALLPPHNFIRIHNSYIIAINKIQAIDGNQVWVGKDNTSVPLPIGSTFKVRFMEVVGSQ